MGHGKAVIRILSSILDLPFPPTCYSCGVFIDRTQIFCAQCEQSIKPIASSFVSITKQHKMKLYAVSAYKNPLKYLVLRKMKSDRLASKQLAQLILKKTYIKNIQADFLIPIPLHWTRYAKRGYNQAHEIAKELSKSLNIPVLNILKRSKRTVFQSTLNPEKRKLNVKNVFAIKYRYKKLYKKLLNGKKILFVDDLCTTGSTLQSAAKHIIPTKPSEINAIVACRVV